MDAQSGSFQAPKVTLFNGARAILADDTRTPFVVGVVERRRGVNEPEIAVVSEGQKLSVRAVQTADRQKIRLNAHFEISRLGSVHKVSTVTLGQPAVIQIPRVSRFHLDTAAYLSDGQWLLISCVPRLEHRQFCYFLISAKAICDFDGETR